jgi:DNA repair protein RadC
MNLSKVNDATILSEYVKRFTITAGEHLQSSKASADHFRAYFADAKHEKFVVCFLNGQHQVIETRTMFVGSLTTSAVYPREVIAAVLDLNSSGIVCAHNHPSGGISPSSSDRAVTKKLLTALNSIDVDLLDHIIVGGSEYFSFSDHRLL